MILHYDGTFDGFLTAVVTARAEGLTPDGIVRTLPEQGGLFGELRRIESDPERARPFAATLRQRLSAEAWRILRYAFQADAPEVGMVLFRYLELGERVGRALDTMIAHDRVLPAWKLARAVGREAHRFKGLVRFQELEGGVWYATIEPDHRIVPLIAPHFAARFADQRWIIHDLRRAVAALFDPGRRETALLPLEVTGPLPRSANEVLFRELWQRYFERLAIAERLNPGLQRQNLPLKHRRHLPEFER
ncbi:TIGR03915 family putative DNA repair protein [Geobacter sp.]|uniref:TIGR03915 family putative DNA repair protein n=1 Tax=Geobacter sp. TaxID=46610 RepID=UPI00260CC212|nr:TIGR03915 family putative DNA repair protein [Geobacter sp.]